MPEVEPTVTDTVVKVVVTGRNRLMRMGFQTLSITMTEHGKKDGFGLNHSGIQKTLSKSVHLTHRNDGTQPLVWIVVLLVIQNVVAVPDLLGASLQIQNTSYLIHSPNRSTNG